MSTYGSRAAAQAVAALAENEKSKPGQVAMPKAFFIVGIIDAVFMGGLGLLALLRFKVIIAAVVFFVFALLGVALIIAYFNERIYYDADKFISSSFWGVKRTYGYGDITGIVGVGSASDIKIYLGENKVSVDRMAVGKDDFIIFAFERYRKLKGGNIPLLNPNKKGDLFNGNIASTGDFIAAYTIVAVCVLVTFGIGLYVAFDTPTPETDLQYATALFNRCETDGDDLWLRTGSDMDFEIDYYPEVLPDADAFLAEYANGGVLKLGYKRINRDSDPDYYKVYYAEGSEGEKLITPEKVCDVFARHKKDNLPKIIAALLFLCLFAFGFIGISIYVGRHADTLNPRIVKFFFKSSYVLCPGYSGQKHKSRRKYKKK